MHSVNVPHFLSFTAGMASHLLPFYLYALQCALHICQFVFMGQ